MGQIVVGIGDCKLASDSGDVLVTYALGSCIGVMVYDPIARVGGLLHYLLPDSRLDPEKSKNRPFVFADTGIPQLFQQAYALGARKERMKTSIVGGSQMCTFGGVLNIGSKNIRAAKQILSRAGVVIEKEVTGGNLARTVRLQMSDGDVILQETQADSKKAALAQMGSR